MKLIETGWDLFILIYTCWNLLKLVETYLYLFILIYTCWNLLKLVETYLDLLILIYTCLYLFIFVETYWNWFIIIYMCYRYWFIHHLEIYPPWPVNRVAQLLSTGQLSCWWPNPHENHGGHPATKITQITHHLKIWANILRYFEYNPCYEIPPRYEIPWYIIIFVA